MDRSPTTAPATERQPTSWPTPEDGFTGPVRRGEPAMSSEHAPSRLGQAIRRFLPSSGPAIGGEPAYSTGGGGFRSGNRPEPPARGGSNAPLRSGGPPVGGGSSGGGGPRMPRGGGNPDPRPERYWTDYLRIALPVIGLILMLSVFIFWVGSIIDGNNDDADVTPSAVALVQTPAPSDGAGAVTATVAPPQSAAPSNAEGANPSPSEAASDGGDTEPTTEPTAEESTAPEDQPTDEPADEEATDPPADGATFAVDDVVVTTDDVRLRSEASSEDDANVIRTLDAGTELTIIGEPENDGEFDWYPVSDDEGEGYVRQDFLEAAAG